MSAYQRISRLDGLRGLAALMVLIAHYFAEVESGLHWLSFGWLGVSIFFVLSGYLIGKIIITEHTQNNFLPRFYKRRAARILPAYALTIMATLIYINITSPSEYIEKPFNPLYYLTFTQNFAILYHGIGNEWLLPTWTLAVEEQFYIILPLLIMATPPKVLPSTFTLIIILSIAFRAIYYNQTSLSTFVMLPGRADLFLLGVTAAYIEKKIELQRYMSHARNMILPPILAMLILAASGNNEAFHVISPTLIGLSAAAFIIGQVYGIPEGRYLENKELVFIGKISYPLYLIHQPVNGIMHDIFMSSAPNINTWPTITLTMLSAAISITLSFLIWNFLEKPIMRKFK